MNILIGYLVTFILYYGRSQLIDDPFRTLTIEEAINLAITDAFILAQSNLEQKQEIYLEGAVYFRS